ncbi:molybdopterin-binding protein [Pseudohalocynthiibacter aestuariivivens]|nr:molybdopterin-binding protein [Pseudohalocynthiibacter aestuariivivens]QIE44536.1 molybdopterin-binding protein [Pseudohalocynthiibacter aestuariivivens]
MIFGPVSLAQAQGGILAHSVAVPGGRLRKGVTIGPDQIAALEAAGIDEVTIARLEPGDLHEDAAATRLAEAVTDGVTGISLSRAFTGRVNLLADGPGVVTLDAAAIRAANMVHPMITIATVPDHQQMRAGGMIATVKIISYAVPQAAVDEACGIARATIAVAVPVVKTATLIVSEIAGGPGDKGSDAIRARLEALGIDLVEIVRVPHETAALAAALGAASSDLVLILTASATSDPNDTAPAALWAAGGQVERFGMPVDPGNLLFLGSLGGRRVIGLPGCVRSPALNGADWVLSRVSCGIDVSHADIAGMGVGGLLKEIPTRPMPRRGRKGAAG